MFTSGRIRSGIITLCMALLASCASHQVGQIDVRTPDAYAMRKSAEGITVAVDPYDTTAKAQEGFYLDVTSQGFFPVLVVIKNDGDDTAVFLRESAELRSADGRIYKPVRSTAMYNAFEHNKMAYALLGFGIFSYMSAEEANRKMETDWREKEMPDQSIILPSRRSHGCLYFQLPAEKQIKGSALYLEVEKTSAKKKVPFDLTLN